MKLWFERGAWASKNGSRKISAMGRLQVRRVAVIRHAALGDMVLVRPFLVEARKFFPNAEIILSLVSNYTYGAPTDLVDRVHVLHGSDQKNISLIDRIRRAKELGQVDMLFDLADTTRSRYLCLLTDATIKIGFPYRWYLRNLLFDAAVPRSDFAFEAVNMLDVLALLGADPTFPLNFGWAKEFDKNVEEGQSESIVYFPFASIKNKCWPKESFIQLIRKCSGLYPNYQHIILGGIEKVESIDSWGSEFQSDRNIGFQPALPLDETLKLLRSASLVVSNDTGIRNLAIALDVPTVGIFFSTVPYRYWPRYGGHAAVFEGNGSIPNVSRVFETVTNTLIRQHQD